MRYFNILYIYIIFISYKDTSTSIQYTYGLKLEGRVSFQARPTQSEAAAAEDPAEEECEQDIRVNAHATMF